MAKRILLVNCYQEKRGEKIRPYVAAIVDAAGAAGAEVLVTGQDDERIAAGATVHRHSALIVSGSFRFVSQGDYFPEFLDFLRSRHIPLLGICYGHQVLARAFGGTVQRDSRKHEGDEEVLLKAADPIFKDFPKGFSMRQSHQEVVRQDDWLLRYFDVLAVNGDGNVEAIRHKKLPFWGVQFHPERSGDLGKKLLANFLSQVP